MIESQDKKVEEISINMKSMMEQLLSIYGKIYFSKIYYCILWLVYWVNINTVYITNF